MQESYEQELSAVLAMMAATLKGASGDKASLAQAWLMVLATRVERKWLNPTCEWFLLHAVFFPTPAEFITKADELKGRAEMDALLASTKRALQESEAFAIEDRRRRNLEAGINPDEMLPIECITPLLGGLNERMLSERNEVQE